MPKPEKKELIKKCSGGNSFGCRRSEHKQGKFLFQCRLCNQFMGCSVCAQNPMELICNRCRDWATRAALQTHGKMVPEHKRTDAMKIVMLRFTGKLSQQDAEREFSELWAL